MREARYGKSENHQIQQTLRWGGQGRARGQRGLEDLPLGPDRHQNPEQVKRGNWRVRGRRVLAALPVAVAFGFWSRLCSSEFECDRS